MSSLRVSSSIKHLTSRSPRHLSHSQRRWARVHDLRFIATQPHDNVTDRYKDKLHQKAKERGLDDIGKLKEAYRDEIQNLRKKAAVPGATAPLIPSSTPSTRDSEGQRQPQNRSPWPQPPPPPRPQPQASTTKATSDPSAPPGVKTLSSFIDLSKAADLPRQELETLWRLRFAHIANSLCATMPASNYNIISRTAKQHPFFILPGLPPSLIEEESSSSSLSSDSTSSSTDSSTTQSSSSTESKMTGAPIHLLQWTFPSPTTTTVLFTHLAEYKLRGPDSQPHTTLTHHLDYASDPSKSLVLCQGSVMPDRGVSVEEARWLIMQLQRFYCVGEDAEIEGEVRDGGGGSKVGKAMKERRRRLVEMFGRGDEAFRVEDLLEEAERLG